MILTPHPRLKDQQYVLFEEQDVGEVFAEVSNTGAVRLIRVTQLGHGCVRIQEIISSGYARHRNHPMLVASLAPSANGPEGEMSPNPQQTSRPCWAEAILHVSVGDVLAAKENIAQMQKHRP